MNDSIEKIENETETEKMVTYAAENKGRAVTVYLMFGNQTFIRLSGILKGSVEGYIIIEDFNSGKSTLCSVKELKFLEFIN